MTQEEKLEEAKRLYKTANADQKYVLESLFPELKESGDERTWIINYLSNRILNSTIIAEKENLKKAIAWVEKQGENISLPKFTFDDVLALQCAMEAANKVQKDKDLYEQLKSLHDRLHDAYWLKKQGEQKSAEISNVCEFSIETWIKIVDYVLTEHNGIGNYLINPEVKDTAEKLQKKYKFDAASEEWDRVYRKGLDAGVNKGKAIALKEQKPADKIQLQTKQEWSEEDERMIEAIEALCDDKIRFTEFQDVKEHAYTVKNWLKSLKDRCLSHPQS